MPHWYQGAGQMLCADFEAHFKIFQKQAPVKQWLDAFLLILS